jgi:hypothetical protein
MPIGVLGRAGLLGRGNLGKFIFHAERLTLAARVAERVSAPEYTWPQDGWCIIAFNHPDGTEEAAFSARKNAKSITVRELARG